MLTKLWAMIRQDKREWHPTAGWFGEMNKMRRWRNGAWEIRPMTEDEAADHMGKFAW